MGKGGSGGIILVIGGLTLLYLFNTGRLQTILQVLKDPSYTPPQGGKKVVSYVSPQGVGYDDRGNVIVQAFLPSGGSGGSGNTYRGSGDSGGGNNTVANAAACYAKWSNGTPDLGCIEDAWKGLNSPEDIWNAAKGAINTVTGLFGIKL